jgi:hypothetical protein
VTSPADFPACPDCGQPHVRKQKAGSHSDQYRWIASCKGHVRYDRDSYVKGQPRKRLPKPRPCRQVRTQGLDLCRAHNGGSLQARTIGKARLEVAKLIGDPGEPVTDPIAKLCAIAGRAVAFMESLGQHVDQLTLGEDAARDQTRADIALYGRSIEQAARVVESIIRMGIAERLAKAEEQQTAAIVAFIDGVLTDLGHNPRSPEVAGVVARRLELVS